MAITRDDVLKALASVTVDAAGTTLPGSGRLSQVVVDPSNRVIFSILGDPSEAERFEPVRRLVRTVRAGGRQAGEDQGGGERPCPPSG